MNTGVDTWWPHALGKIKSYKLSLDDKEALHELPETCHLADQASLQVAGRILQDSTLFYSCLHRTDGAKNNRVCQFAFDGEVGVAEVDFFYCSFRTACYAQDIPIIIYYIHGHYSLVLSTQWKH